DGADGVAPGHVALALVNGGEEDDRRVLRLLALADQGGGLEAVYIRHLNVEKDHGKLVVQEVLERFAAGGRLDQVLAEVAEDRLQGDQVLGAVVDQQDVDLVRRLHFGSRATRAGRLPAGQDYARLTRGAAL